jgi:D-aminopeptidase
VQTNFGSREELMITGASMRGSGVPNPISDSNWFVDDQVKLPPGAGSIIVIIATDAPLLPGQCKALARRVPLGLGRTGTSGSHFSGDIFLAFSTANQGALRSDFPVKSYSSGFDHFESIPWGRMDAFYEATVQAVEEAILNSLISNEDMTGRDGHRSYAIPHELIRVRNSRTDMTAPN